MRAFVEDLRKTAQIILEKVAAALRLDKAPPMILPHRSATDLFPSDRASPSARVADRNGRGNFKAEGFGGPGRRAGNGWR
jgi:hypothetical protein